VGDPLKRMGISERTKGEIAKFFLKHSVSRILEERKKKDGNLT